MKKSKTLYIIICFLLLLNVVSLGLYLHEIAGRDKKPADDKTAVEDTAGSKADADKKDDKGAGGDVDPLIAVVDYDTDDASRMVEIIGMAGGKAERVGSIEDLDINKYDAILIPGGNSVTPSMYGAEQQPETTNTDIEKDKFQFEAVRMYAEAGKPVLGICRGEQLVNNVFGGTTIQDMPEGWHKYERNVKIAEGSWLYDLMGPEEETYHFHHQCVDELGDGLYATQWDEETGYIEGYEHKTLPVYGLQWHPEGIEATGVDVFRSYIDIVKENMQQNK